LRDILVVDLSRALAGPHATMMLGDLGARVVKVEAPGRGDDTRGWGPPFVGEADARESTYFLSANRNKESITLDLKAEEDRDVLLRLVDRADVLVENFRTGVLERLGLGIDALQRRNPRLVVLSITGFGHDGPEGGRAGYDQIAQGEAGLMSLTGSGPDDPQRVGVPIADLLSGMYGAYGVLAALHERTTTGVGTVVRTSLLAATVGAAYINIEPFNFLLTMVIAVAKGAMILLIFMHVRYSDRLTWVFSTAAFLWLGILIAFTLNDYFTRDLLNIPGK